MVMLVFQVIVKKRKENYWNFFSVNYPGADVIFQNKSADCPLHLDKWYNFLTKGFQLKIWLETLLFEANIFKVRF